MSNWKEIYSSRIFGFFFLLQFFIYFTSPYFPLDLFGHILSFSLKADANSHWRLQLMKLHLLPHHEILRWKRSWAPECFAFGDVFCNCIPHTSGHKSQPRSKSPPIPILFRTHLTNQNIKNYFFKKYIFLFYFELEDCLRHCVPFWPSHLVLCQFGLQQKRKLTNYFLSKIWRIIMIIFPGFRLKKHWENMIRKKKKKKLSNYRQFPFFPDHMHRYVVEQLICRDKLLLSKDNHCCRFVHQFHKRA